MLEIQDISVSYGIVPVLHNVSLNIKENEIVALLGSNGAGKTTLLNAISGLIKPKSGSIILESTHIEGLPPHKILEEGISQVPEGRRVFSYMTVKENLLLGAYSSKAQKRKNESLEWVFSLFPVLKERSKSQARLLSGGEQQMLAVGRGLMARPKLLLVDEPSIGLAPKVLFEVYGTIEGLRKEKVTILLSEQNAQYALKLADRGYVLQDGKVALEGPSNELLGSDLVRKAYFGR